MAKSKIKDSAKGVVIGFNNSAKPLGERNDLDQLAILAHESGRQDYKDLFEKLPSLEELRSAKVDAELDALKATPPVQQGPLVADLREAGSTIPDPPFIASTTKPEPGK